MSLRDFFIASNSAEIACAYESLVKALQSSAPTVESWDELEFSFNRLFIGPDLISAPPFASIYIEEEPYVMGDTTLTVRRLYQMAGLVSPWEGKIPEDHISLELDACLNMRTGLLTRYSAHLHDLYGYFLDKHMTRWIPLFIARVDQDPKAPDTICWVCRKLDEWLNKEREWVDQLPRNG